MGDGKPYLYAVYKTHILWSSETSLFWFFLKEIWNCKVVERNSWMISLFGCLKSQNNQGRECYVVSCLWISFQHVQMERTYYFIEIPFMQIIFSWVSFLLLIHPCSMKKRSMILVSILIFSPNFLLHLYTQTLLWIDLLWTI